MGVVRSGGDGDVSGRGDSRVEARKKETVIVNEGVVGVRRSDVLSGLGCSG
jgi:hypothetical protein